MGRTTSGGKMTSEEKKIFKGRLFNPEDKELVAIKTRSHRLCHDFNLLYEEQVEERERLLKEILGDIGENTFLAGPIMFHYGVHTTIGKNSFINFNFTCQDDAKVTIGDNANFGPNVTIVTPMHPKLPEERHGLLCPDGERRYLCYAKPVVIGNECWIGANVVICPGVTIGDNCVIGAGSVVTKDIPANSIAVGNPARVLKKLDESDSIESMGIKF